MGIWDVERWLKRMSGKQLAMWEYYAVLDPFAEWRADARAATICSIVANTMGRSKGQRPYTIDDFILKFDEGKKKQKQGPEQHAAWIRMIAASYANQPDTRSEAKSDAWMRGQ